MRRLIHERSSLGGIEGNATKTVMVAIRKCTGNFVRTQVDDEILIVDHNGGELFSITGTAETVWQGVIATD